MTEPIIIGLFTLAGTMLGGLISFLIARNAKEIKTLKSQVNTLSNQVISYWNIENLYSKEISKLTLKAQKTVKQEYREKIEAMELDRPTMTEKEAKKILIKNSLLSGKSVKWLKNWHNILIMNTFFLAFQK
jgi:hypothetical protein